MLTNCEVSLIYFSKRWWENTGLVLGQSYIFNVMVIFWATEIIFLTFNQTSERVSHQKLNHVVMSWT